jgi:hypothetical protein
MTAPLYLTLAQVKAYMPTNEVSTVATWDTMVTTLCTNLSRAFDSLTFRQIGAYAVNADVTAYFDGVSIFAGAYTESVFVDELAAAPTSIGVSMSGNGSYVNLTPSDFWLWPYNAANNGKPYTRIDLNTQTGAYKSWPTYPHSVKVVGKFGYSVTVPDDVYEALLLYAVRMIRKAQTNYLEVGTLLDSGQVLTGMKRDEDLLGLIALYKKGRLTS